MELNDMTKTTVPEIVCLALVCAFSSGAEPVDNSKASRAVTVTAPQAQQAVRGLTLQECIAQALTSSPRAVRDRYLIDAASAGLDRNRGERLPTLSARANYRHSLDNVRLTPARDPGEVGTFADDVGALDAVVRLPLYSGGGITAGIDAARAGVDAAAGNLTRTRQELVYDVTALFYAILGQRKGVDSVDASRKAMDEHRRRVADLLAASKVARVDLLRTEVRLADLEQRQVRETNVLAIYHRRLVNLLGGMPKAPPFAIVGDLALQAGEPPELAPALAAARIARPDLAAARAAVEAQAAKVVVARAGGRPAVSLEASFGGRWAIDPETRQSGADSSEDAGFIGVAVEIPIFQGGRVSAAAREERARLAAQQESLRELDLVVQLQVETALLNARSSALRVKATTKAIEQAAESLRIERARYELGKGSMTDVLDAQAAQLDAETIHAQAQVEHATALAELRLATGE